MQQIFENSTALLDFLEADEPEWYVFRGQVRSYEVPLLPSGLRDRFIPFDASSEPSKWSGITKSTFVIKDEVNARRQDFPIEHQARIKTTNMVERLNCEIKRRTNVVRVFPNPASALRLIASVCMKQNEEWVTGKKYLNMEYLNILNIMKKTKENKTVLVAVT